MSGEAWSPLGMSDEQFGPDDMPCCCRRSVAAAGGPDAEDVECPSCGAWWVRGRGKVFPTTPHEQETFEAVADLFRERASGGEEGGPS